MSVVDNFPNFKLQCPYLLTITSLLRSSLLSIMVDLNARFHCIAQTLKKSSPSYCGKLHTLAAEML